MPANAPETVIRTPDQRLRVFISSTMKELAAERAAAREAVSRLRLTPVLFEAGARPHPPRELYRAYLDQSDIFIGIYGSEYGWVAPGMDISGLEDEYLLAVTKPRLIYVKSSAERDPRLAEMLGQIAAEGAISYQRFTAAEQLRDLIENDLAVFLSERFTNQPAEPHVGVAARDLPAPVASIIGREADVETLTRLLSGESPRLLTLTGPGGIGKTRLALSAANRLRPMFADGVAYVPLAGVHDHSLVAPTIASDLGVHDPGNRPLIEVFSANIRDKRLLLLIDNFEQVIEAASFISDLLAAAPGLKVLVTSRRPLRLYGESEFPVSPLAVPAASSEQIDESAAVQLFVQRAAWARPGFTLTGENAAVVAEICRRLDGIPLAIELAAARLRFLSPQALLDRLSNRLEALTGGASDLPQRQRTIRDTIGWSYELLESWEKDVFAQVSVFAGGFSLHAAEAVCDVTNVPGGDVLSALTSLVERSLLGLGGVETGQTRFQMLEVIRDFAVERLREAGTETALRSRHAAHFGRVLAEVEQVFCTVGGEEWSARIERDQDNLRAALEWSLIVRPEDYTPDADWPLLNVAMTFYWYLRGSLTEGRQWADRVLESARVSEDKRWLANALKAVGSIAMWQGDLQTSRELLEESVSLSRELGDERSLAMSLMVLGVTAVNQGDTATAGPALEEALPFTRRAGLHRNTAIVLMHLGNVAAQLEDFNLATQRFEEALTVTRPINDAWMLASLLNNLGEVARCQGDHSRARGYYEECHNLFKRQEAAGDATRASHNLAYCDLREAKTDEAAAGFRAALASYERLGIGRGIAECLIGLAGVAAHSGESERGAHLLGAGDAILESLGAQLWPADALEYQRASKTLKHLLGGDTYNDRYRAGAEMSRDEALALAGAAVGARSN
jgi:predicted ATPase